MRRVIALSVLVSFLATCFITSERIRSILDILRRKIETKYLYENKKIAVQVYSSEAQFWSNATIASNDKPIESNYEIHFWIVVRESPNKLLSL